MDRVDTSHGVFITAEGLLMYLDPADVRNLIADDGVALAGVIPGVHAARDIALRAGRGPSKLTAWPPLHRIGPLRRARPRLTLLEFGR